MANINESMKIFDEVPEHILQVIESFVLGVAHHEIEIGKPYIRKSVTNIYPFIVTMYAILIIVGVISNLAVFYHIIRHKLYEDATYSFILNNVISDIIKCVCVLPVSLYVLLTQVWMLGELLCSFLPMIQVRKITISSRLNFPMQPNIKCFKFRRSGFPRLFPSIKLSFNTI